MAITLRNLSEKVYTLSNAKVGASALNVNLKEAATSTLLPYIVDKSLFMRLCKNVVLESDTLGIKVVKQQGTKWEEKSVLGTGTAGKWRVTKPITVEWNQPIKTYEAYTAIEKRMADKAISSAAKIEKILIDFSRLFERTSFQKLENKVTDENKREKADLLSLAPLDAKKKLVSKATELTMLVDPEQGIDLINAEDIVILVKPTILDHIALAGLSGDRVNETFTNGQYSVSNIGGYEVLSVPFLSKYDAIVTTKFVAAAAQQIIALNAGKVDNLSEDEGVYAEAMLASGIIWDKLVYGYYKETNAPTKSENIVLVNDTLQ